MPALPTHTTAGASSALVPLNQEDANSKGELNKRTVIVQDSPLLTLLPEELLVFIAEKVILQEGWSGLQGLALSCKPLRSFVIRIGGDKGLPYCEFAFNAWNKGLWEAGSFVGAVKGYLDTGKVVECAQLLSLVEADRTERFQIIPHATAYGLNLEATNEKGESLLHMATHLGCQRLFSDLMDAGLGIELMDTSKLTVLSHSAILGDPAMASFILSKGANVSSVDTTNSAQAIHYAAAKDNVSVLEVLLKHKAQMDARESSGSTPVHYAAIGACHDALRFLLVRGAQVDATDLINNTPLHEAAREGHSEIVEILLNHNAQIEAVNAEGMRPLHHAAREGKLKTVVLLLKQGAQREASDNDGTRALHYAACSGSKEIVAVLLDDYGVELESEDDEGNRALHYAVFYDKPTIVSLLVSRGAVLNGVNREGETPLHLAAQGGSYKIMDALLAADSEGTDFSQELRESSIKKLIDVYEADEAHARVPLLNVVLANNCFVVAKLLLNPAYDIDLNAKEAVMGWAALHCAAQNKNQDMIDALLEAGADPELKDKSGDTYKDILEREPGCSIM